MDQSRPNELPKIGNSSLRTFQFALQSNFFLYLHCSNVPRNGCFSHPMPLTVGDDSTNH